MGHSHRGRAVRRTLGRASLAAALVGGLLGLTAAPVHAGPVASPTLTQASTDSVVNHAGTGVQNTTHVETDTFGWGSTVVSAFQVGRSSAGFGAAAIGYATSTDDGQTWSHGLLPGLTASSPSPNSTYPLVVNESVAYDAAHATWLVPAVTYVATGGSPPFHETALLVSHSADGLSWGTPVTAVGTNVDKAWGVCDNTTTSAHYGTCYVAYSEIDSGDSFAIVTSSDGGATWSTPVHVSDGAGGNAVGYNVVPVVRPDGMVVVVATDLTNGKTGSVISSFNSTDGGVTWSVPAPIATIKLHNVGGVRALNKPTVDTDANGQLDAVWSDCRFQTHCTSNDLVRSASTDGIHWTAPSALALDTAAGGVDKFDPGVAVAPGTAGATAQLSVVYYTFAACSTTCIDARYSTSYDGGATWSPSYALNTSPMPITWFASSPKGRMAGDYNSVSFVHGSAVTVMPLATAAPQPYHQTEWALALPPGWPQTTTPPPPPPVAPSTTLVKHPKRTVKTKHARVKVHFRFTADQAGATFQCKLDHQAWKACASPKAYRLRKGRHVFRVRAAHAGLLDATPAKWVVTVKRTKPSHSSG